ncbi:hypothetical protein MMB17_05595 [Methylobacterium organophilum]|uniref:hypothetical protein n=1 Tax=Methylobacterium organophilum TaxID=410 RepID=UPI001F12D8AD|nr:hypothetical protein [Methylobacterium organophilum]UMY18790.1 hypothetical protein MMB17_05595 [Methylobacterium organophilum]
MFARFLAYLSALFASIGELTLEGVSHLRSAGRAASSAVSEAASMLWDDLSPARKAAKAAGKGAAAVGRGAATVGAGTVIATGTALEGAAGVVGRTLGALLPTAPVTARQVADGAVARDDNRGHRVDPEYQAAHDGLRDACLVGIKLQGAASSLLSRGGPLHAIHADGLTPPVTAWLESLSPAQLKAVVDAPSYALDRHLKAEAKSDLLPGLPPVLSTVARQAQAANAGELDMAEMLAKAKANLRGSKGEAEAMMQRGTSRRPPEGPEEGGQVVPIRGPRPTPRPSFG